MRTNYLSALFIVVSMFIGMAIGSYYHPYERCERKGYTTPNDIGECVWLLQN